MIEGPSEVGEEVSMFLSRRFTFERIDFDDEGKRRGSNKNWPPNILAKSKANCCCSQR